MLPLFYDHIPNGILATSAALALIAARLRSRRKKVHNAHLRGRSLKTTREAQASLERSCSPNDPGIQCGRLRIPSEAVYSHIAVLGATGSGKTIIQRLIMQSALPLIGKGLGHRALIYDAKQDLWSVLSGMGLPCPVRTLNPLDARGVAWDMASDITCPASALQVASIFIPDSKNDSNPFFAGAARHLLYGALIAFIQNPGRHWTFRELLLTMRDPKRLTGHLAQTETTRFLLQYFDHPATFQNIISTLLTHLAPFEIIAAAWDRAEESISLSGWLEEESILVLGNDEANRAAIEAMNRLILRRISQLVLTQKELTSFGPNSPRTWFFLDEVREAGRLEGLSRLLTNGRSKGAAVVLGFQDIAGLIDVYGQDVANELVGQCSIKVILRLNSPETAAWASRLMGSREVIESRRGESRDYRNAVPPIGHTGESISHGVATRRVVLDSEFFDLPVTSPQNGMTGFFITPITGAFKDHLPGPWISEHLLAPDSSKPNFVPRLVSHQYLRPLSTTREDHEVDQPVSQPWSH